jgi:cell pole-organizing protein PopZ
MSKPDPTGESLESILASIRKSLSEQSTGVLEEEAPAAPDAGKGAISGLTRRLADETDDLPPLVEDAAPVEPGTGALRLPEDPPPGDPTAVAQPPAPPEPAPVAAQPQTDALWFLGGRGSPGAPESEPPPAAADAARPADASLNPAPSRTGRSGVLRGPLPPFFGSSPEAQKAEVVLVQASAPGVGMMLPPAAPPPKAANGQAGPAVAPAADGLRNGAVNGLFGHVASDARAAPEGATPHVHALEAVVAELLRPMLQRWLDENMPRLVAAALKDEAVRIAARDPRKP